MGSSHVRIDLPYRDPKISNIEIPCEYLNKIYRLPQVKPVLNVDTEVENALAHPIGTQRLRDMVNENQRIAIIVDDITRPTPAGKILPGVLHELAVKGIPKNQISIVIALGSHRKMTELEIETKLTKEVYETYQISQSHFNDPSQLVLVGKSDDGVDIFIDAQVARADFKIGIGSIVPHGAVGWSGGGKIIYPGVAGESTVTQFHYTHGLTEANLTGMDETSVRTRLENWVEVVGLDFIVNCVLTPLADVYHVVAGHYIRAHRAGVLKAHEAYVQEYSRQDDIVVSVSHPHDPDFWQAGKGFYCAESLVRDGGALIVATPCPEGLGNHISYPERIGREDNVEIIKSILSGIGKVPEDPIPLAPAAMMAKIRKRIHLHMTSPGLTQDMIGKAGITYHQSIQSGLDVLISQYHRPSISVVLSAEICFYKKR